MPVMRIKKAKRTSENKINIVYEKRSRSGGWDEYSLSCSDEPRPEFKQALDALIPHVIDMGELPDHYSDRIEVRGVSFSYGGANEVMGATISAGMKLENSYTKLNLNTPHKASESYNEGPADEMQLLTDKCVRALDNYCEEVEAYINGERAQLTLFKSA